MKKDRRPTSAVSSHRTQEDVDPFDEDETERRFLESKPTCFIVFGKPGSGKTTFCKNLSRIWKCQLVNGPSSIAQAIELQTDLGKQAQEILQKGEILSEELTLKIVEERLKSPEVSHYGYVLDDFPYTSEEYLSVDDQFEFIKKLPLQPDFVINLRIPDEDLFHRRRGFRVDPLTNEIYTEERYNPPEVLEEETVEEEDDEDEGENVEADGDEDEESGDEEEEDFTDLAEEEELAPDLLERLMPRTEDFEENMKNDIQKYKELLLRKIEDYMGNHERQKVVEMDANMPMKYLIKALIQKLESMGAPRAAIPLRLQGGEDQENIPEDTETDDLLRTLAATECIAPGFRWRRSRWGRVCPVALYEGNIIQGSPQFAVSFLDKLYVMSSMDALEKFMRNPRRYVKDPQPRNPCKLCIVGPPLSGKTALANELAEKYGAKVFDVDAMIKPRREAQRAKLLEDVRAEALETAIARVTAIVQQEKLAAEQARKLQEDEDKKSEESEEEASKEDGDESDGNENENEVKDAADAEERVEAQDDENGDKNQDATEIKEDNEEQPEQSSRKPSNASSDKGIEDVVVDENHPQVMKMVQEAVEEAQKRDLSISADECVDILEEAIHDHYNRMQELHPLGPIAGRWILDNFPHTREQFNIMVERGILPDNLICLKDNSDGGELLLKRWFKIKKQSDPTNSDESTGNEGDEDEMPPKSPELDAHKSAILDFDKNWTSLQGALRSASNLEPVLIDCSLDEEQIEAEAVLNLEAQFQYKGWEYTGMDQDEEEEDLAADEDEYDEEEEDEDAFNKDKRKPFGDTRHYCPIALKENHVLWPGSPECAAKYRERVYYFSSPEARSKFLDGPKEFLAEKEPLKPPALRLIVLGAKGSGKTLVGRELAKKFGVFHISFKDRLQELIIAKTKKRIGPDYPEEEPEAAENEELSAEDKNQEKTESENATEKESEEDPVVEEEEEEVEFTDIEANIRDNITDNEPLSNETLESIIPAWWKEEPFSSTGFILEGFPRTPEETRYLSEAGLYPDCVINLATEEKDIVKRLMPPLLEKWRNKRDKKLAKKQKELEAKMKKREEEKVRRKEEKMKEIAQKKAERQFGRQSSLDSNEDSDDQMEEEEDEEEEEDIEAIVEAEMAEEEEEEETEEEEESEEEATERIRIELTERFDEEMETISSLQEILEEFMIPTVDVEAGRKSRIVQFVIEKNLRPVIENRESLFDRSQPISSAVARKMLIQGYKQLSKFGKWCAVQLSEGNVLPPFESTGSPLFPLVYRQHIYFFSSEESRDKFVLCPFKYIHQQAPKPIIPIRLAIIGPPKSGKTTLSNRFVKEYGVMRLSAGEALRNVTTNQSKTSLSQQILEFLKCGEIVPDELVAQAVDVTLLNMQCQTRGYILDGYPVTERQVQFLTERSIIPYNVIELMVDSKSVFFRAGEERSSPNRNLPLHDSHMITAVKLGAYLNSVGPIRSWYQDQHRNLKSVDGEESKWKVWNAALMGTKTVVKKIQIYLQRTALDKAACIADLCITPTQLNSRLGIFGHYCPVSYVDKGELVDCAPDETQKYAAEFRGHYYKMAREIELGIFLENPERYTPPHVEKKLPPDDLLPKKLSASDLKEMFPVRMELSGFCPVTYLDGDLRYEALVPGDNELVVKYKERLFVFVSEAKREKFMKLPEKYASLKLPRKLPPKREPIPVSGLPMLGYMEQTLEVAVRKAATAVGCLKPKFPFLSAKQSALIYMAYHLKAYNPKASEYVRTKYKKKLEKFETQCELIQYLGKNMTRKYKEPEDRLIDFDNKLTNFMSLKSITTARSKP